MMKFHKNFSDDRNIDGNHYHKYRWDGNMEGVRSNSFGDEAVKRSYRLIQFVIECFSTMPEL